MEEKEGDQLEQEYKEGEVQDAAARGGKRGRTLLKQAAHCQDLPEMMSQSWPASSPARATMKPWAVMTVILSIASRIRLRMPSCWNKSWRFLRARRDTWRSLCSAGVAGEERKHYGERKGDGSKKRGMERYGKRNET